MTTVLFLKLVDNSKNRGNANERKRLRQGMLIYVIMKIVSKGFKQTLNHFVFMLRFQMKKFQSL